MLRDRLVPALEHWTGHEAVLSVQWSPERKHQWVHCGHGSGRPKNGEGQLAAWRLQKISFLLWRDYWLLIMNWIPVMHWGLCMHYEDYRQIIFTPFYEWMSWDLETIGDLIFSWLCLASRAMLSQASFWACSTYQVWKSWNSFSSHPLPTQHSIISHFLWSSKLNFQPLSLLRMAKLTQRTYEEGIHLRVLWRMWTVGLKDNFILVYTKNWNSCIGFSWYKFSISFF